MKRYLSKSIDQSSHIFVLNFVSFLFILMKLCCMLYDVLACLHTLHVLEPLAFTCLLVLCTLCVSMSLKCRMCYMIHTLHVLRLLCLTRISDLSLLCKILMKKRFYLVNRIQNLVKSLRRTLLLKHL